MVLYFERFPTILYDIAGNKIENAVLNITHRVRLRKKIIDIGAVFYNYIVQDSDTPSIIAHKYYGSSNYHWVVLFSNDIIHPYFDWPLTYEDFQATMISIYGDLRTAQRTTFQLTDLLGNVIDQQAYDALPADERLSITAYDYYFALNESKRAIKLLDKSFIPRVEQELTDLLNLPQ